MLRRDDYAPHRGRPGDSRYSASWATTRRAHLRSVHTGPVTQHLSTPLLVASALLLISAGLHLHLGNKPLAGALVLAGLGGATGLLVTSHPPVVALALLGAAVALPACAASVCLSQPPTHGSATQIAGLTGGGIALAAAQVLVQEPFRDPTCRSWCPRSPLLVRWEPALGWAFLVASTALTAALWVLAGRRSMGAIRTRPGLRRTTGALGLLTVCLGMAVAAAILIAGRGAMTATTLSGVTALIVPLWFGVAAVALSAAGAQVLTLARLTRAGEMVSRVVGPDSSEDLLRSALGDPAALIYPADGRGGFADADGRPLPPPGPARHRTVLSRAGVPVAALDHAADVSPDSLSRRLGPGVLLALHNDSLRRQLETRVIELTASRRRVVEHADQTRAALERDLHDGAQQRVLALRIASSQGQSAATARGEAGIAQAFGDAGQAAQEALEGLRALAGSIHPAILDGAGLRAALQHLADSHPSPFVLDASALAVLPQDLERTGYAIIRDAARHGVSRVTVSTSPDLHLDVVTRANVPDTVRDRVAAAGGTIREHSDRWEARLPCE